MRLLIKDHKKVSREKLPSTRPVVSACKGINVPLNNILSELLEPLAKHLMGSEEVASSEHLLNLVESVNKAWEGDKAWNGVDPLPIAADASALYPSPEHK